MHWRGGAEVWIQMKLDGEEKTLRQKYNEGWGKEKYSANRMREWAEEMKERKKARRGIEYLRLNMVGGLRQKDESSLNQRLHFSLPLSPFSVSAHWFFIFSFTFALYPLYHSLSGFLALEYCCFFNISFFCWIPLFSVSVSVSSSDYFPLSFFLFT